MRLAPFGTIKLYECHESALTVHGITHVTGRIGHSILRNGIPVEHVWHVQLHALWECLA